jgi:DNA-binding MarR family transcriptional regulator
LIYISCILQQLYIEYKMPIMDTPKIRHFRRILRRFERVNNTQLRHCCAGVTLAQCLVLMEVDEDECLSVGQLASRLRLDTSTLSRTIDGLVRKDMLDRARDEQDRRIVWIRLTPAGAAVCSAIHRQNDSIYRAVFEKIPAARRETVIRNFEILVQAFLESEDESAAKADCGPAEADVGHGKRRNPR